MIQTLTTIITIITSVSESVMNGYCDRTLHNKDFEEGTFRITYSGTYCIGENIIFNPKPGTYENPNEFGAWSPTDEYNYPGSLRHDSGGWALGFFAGISIEHNNVEINLQGYTMEMGKEFYIQQRWFNVIQIQNAAFNFQQGPANFGQTLNRLRNIYIHNGVLGLSSHNGMHGFDTDNVYVSDLKIQEFEVAGLQFNGFWNVTIRNVEIGPSSTQVPFWAYYSHARFSLNGFELIPYKDSKYVRFNGGRTLTVLQIYENLRRSMDIAYRWVLGMSTEADKADPLYTISIKMFENEFGLPDGSAVYGMIFNSNGLATQGFGDSPNNKAYFGNILHLDNVNIHDLMMNINEIPALYLDRCEGFIKNRDGSYSVTPIFGRFGDLFDIRRTLPIEKWDYMDKGLFDYLDLIYYGNPLSDAQVALNVFENQDMGLRTWGYGATDDPERGNQTFIEWATAGPHEPPQPLPQCAKFACNSDAMFHTNKGIVGLRLDGIENVFLRKVRIYNLFNKSPLGSLACGSYTGPDDGAQPKSLKKEGVMGSDVRGISIINGGNVEIYEELKISNLVSNNGDVIGIHLMDNGYGASIYLDEPEYVLIDNLIAGATVTASMYQQLKYNGFNPYPNNFYSCNIRAEYLKNRDKDNYPHVYTSYGYGYIYPEGALYCKCYEMYYNYHGRRSRRLLASETIIDENQL